MSREFYIVVLFLGVIGVPVVMGSMSLSFEPLAWLLATALVVGMSTMLFRAICGVPIAMRVRFLLDPTQWAWLSDLFQYLANAIRAGYSVPEALEYRLKDKMPFWLRHVLRNVNACISEGAPLSTAMSRNPALFRQVDCSIVEAGEKAERLPEALEFLAKSQRAREMRNFPILLVLLEFLVCPLVVSFVLVMIVPKFQDIYAQLGGELPLSTLWLIRGSDLLFHQFHWILVAALLLAILVLRFRMKAGFRTAVLKTVPGLRVAAWSPALSRFSFALGELLQAGIGLESAMRLAVKAAGNTILRDREELMVKQLENGKPLDHVLGEVPTIPARYLWMVSRGVKRERPGETLVGLADGCRRDFESFLFGLTSTVFPLLVVLLGAMVLFCVVALYEPLFNIPRIVGRE